MGTVPRFTKINARHYIGATLTVNDSDCMR